MGLAAEIAEISVRLADVGEADEGDVGQQLELEPQPALLALLALLGERRRPAPVRQEPGVAPPAPAAGRGQPAVAGSAPGRRAPRPPAVAHHGALGHADDQVVAALAVALLALTVGAVAGPAVGVVAEREQRGDVAVGDEPDVAAVAAVAAVGAAPGDVGLAPERHRARAAVAPLDVEPALVDERRLAGHGSVEPTAWCRRPDEPECPARGGPLLGQLEGIALDAGPPGGGVAGARRVKW